MSAGLLADLSGVAGLGGCWCLPRCPAASMMSCSLARSMSAARCSRSGLVTPSRCRTSWTAPARFTRVACDGWFGRGRVRRARAGIAAGVGGGPGGGQQVAGCPDGCGRLAGLRGRFGGSFSGVLAQAQQGVDVAGEGGREGTGDVHGVGQGPGGDQEPARAGRGSYPLALGVGQAGHGVAGVVGGGQRQRDVAGMRGKVMRWPGLMAGPAGQGPRGIGVGQAAGAQGEVARPRRRWGPGAAWCRCRPG